MTTTPVRAGTTQATDTAKPWTLIGMILASGVVFLDGTVVNVALPAIDRSLAAGLSGLQWIVDGYALTLAALLILGGSLGDRYGRKRMMIVGLVGFGVASVACGVATTTPLLIAMRMAQGVAGALVVPESLAILTAVYANAEERGQAIGAWTGWGGIATVFGPFLGGWLVDRGSWRLVFFINVPLIAAAVFVIARFVPETRDDEATGNLDWAGAALAVFGLGGATYGLIEGPAVGWLSPAVLVALIGGVVLLALFVLVEARVQNPMVPLGFFRVRNFTGANLATLGVYAALSGAIFSVVLYVQNVMGFSAVAAGASLLPISAMMFLFAARAGKLAGRFGPRFFMIVGPAIVGAGMLLFLRVAPQSGYWGAVFPAVMVLSAGLCLTVAPLTTTVMTSVPAHNSGIASAINNVASRVAGLLAIAGVGIVVALAYPAALGERAAGVSPQMAGIVRDAVRTAPGGHAPADAPPDAARAIAEAYTVAFHRTMLACALLALGGAAFSAVVIRNDEATDNGTMSVTRPVQASRMSAPD